MTRRWTANTSAQIALATLLVAACAAGASATPSPSPSPLPTASVAPSPTAAATATATAAATASPAVLIPEGIYISGPQGIAAFMAQVNADSALTAAEKTAFLNDPLNACTNQFTELDLHAGNWTQSSACDLAGFEVGSRAVYAFPDDHTVVIQETCCGATTFAVKPFQGGFSLTRTSAPADESDRLIGELLFESSPFMLQEASPRAIPDGSYVSATMQIADLIATIKADKKLTAAQQNDLINNAFEFPGHTTFAVTLQLLGGQWTQAQSLDGSSLVGSRATYTFPDHASVLIEEQCCGTTTFAVSWAEGSFSLKRVSATSDAEDAMAGQILFESSPFTLVP